MRGWFSQVGIVFMGFLLLGFHQAWARPLGNLATQAEGIADSARVSERPDVLLITVDTLRPDVLGWIGGGDLTPAIDRLAAGGLRFAGANSPIPITLPSHTSIMTGLNPRRHGVRDNGQRVADDLETLAERLRSLGYRTAAFVSGYPLVASFGLDQGFDHYDDNQGFRGDSRERNAGETAVAALTWAASEDKKDPWFLWVHFYDPHDPYEPEARFARTGALGDYRGEVAAVDAAISDLLQGIGRSKRRLLTVFAADHGESFGEHGEATHGYFLYQSTVAVPIIVHLPGVVEAREGRRGGALVDITPTVLDLLEADIEAGLDGTSLIYEGKEPEVSYLETRRPWYSYGWSPLRAVVEDQWKLVVAPRPELYNLKNDPDEILNLLDSERPRVRRLQKHLRQIEARGNRESAVQQGDSEAIERLESLGYVGSGRLPRAIPTSGLADPKDRIDLWNQLGAAEAFRSQGEFTRALSGFDVVLEIEPDNPFALSRSGALLTSSGQAEQIQRGIERLTKSVTLVPTDGDAWQVLATAYGKLGQWPEAIEAWQEVVGLQPRLPSAWIGLASALGLGGSPREAVIAFEGLLEIVPKDPEARVRTAFARVGAGDLSGAVMELEVAARLSGAAFQHAGALGILMSRIDRMEEARVWLRRSTASEGDFVEARIVLAKLEIGSSTEAARTALAEALVVDPTLATRLANDPILAVLLP